ncbi:MAG: cobyrinate a,c-diamide synthase [Nitrospirae bacterium]|nr:cobyrinate a,c-diamide synthase [Nitrospirota bacterium]
MKSAFTVSAIQSGAGKTTVSLALMASLKRLGFDVQPFKAGPDFIDPGLHRAITGKTSWNLDRWMCSDDYVRQTFITHASASDVAVVEGVMGLFDGGETSTAALAKLVGLPIVLVLDVRGMAESAAAVVAGILSMDNGLTLAGVILNRVGSPKHLQRVRAAIDLYTGVEVIGAIPTEAKIHVQERHLGLFTAEDGPVNEEFTGSAATLARENINLHRLLSLTTVPSDSVYRKDDSPYLLNRYCHISGVSRGVSHTGGTLAVARDKAFCFYYEDNFELLVHYGVKIVFFSPLDDEALPGGIDGLYLGGGYPELYAVRLSGNISMRESIRRFVSSGRVVYAECGGFMYLTNGINDFDGHYYPMVGTFPVSATMKRGRVHLGYREVTLAQDTIIGKKGDRLRGHEFHYSVIDEMPSVVKRVYTPEENAGGYQLGNCLASYVHLHFAGGSGTAAVALANSLAGSAVNFTG